MCTVSFIPLPDGFIFSSTRDEVIHRETLSPAFYQVSGKNLVFPKDKLSNGTWIASDGEQRSVCLLNGAWSNHQKQAKYKMSRGLIPLKVFEYVDFEAFCAGFDFAQIEPFTLISLQEAESIIQLQELRWDGMDTYLHQLDDSIPHLWSSYTLYPPHIQEKRNLLFKKFLEKSSTISPSQIREFHFQKSIKDPEHSVCDCALASPISVSLTQLVRNCDSLDLLYLDLLAKTENHLSIKSPQCI